MWKVIRRGELKKPRDVLAYYNVFKSEPLTIYYDDELILDHIPSEYCGCGKLYTDNPAGKPFMAKSTVHLNKSVESVKQILRMPELCFYCYYKNELAQGRWAPKAVKALD